MTAVDAYIALRGSHNITEQSDVPSDRMSCVEIDAAGIGAAGESDQVGRAALADRRHGPAGQG